MSHCSTSNCLGHADERTAEVLCSRCGGTYWTPVRPASAPDTTSYRCARCTRVLASDPNVVDPLGRPWSPERLARARESRLQSLAEPRGRAEGQIQVDLRAAGPRGSWSILERLGSGQASQTQATQAGLEGLPSESPS